MCKAASLLALGAALLLIVKASVAYGHLGISIRNPDPPPFRIKGPNLPDAGDRAGVACDP